ncbi:MAG: DUF2029 domain-containing protein [Planctomycetes bacterium]|nr:DUF2029 domain-containing protein [Planctomycetota bacterium]
MVALLALSSAWAFGERWPGIDFYQFWTAGRALREGRVTNVYTAQARAQLGEEGFQAALRTAGPEAAKKPTLELQVAQYRRQMETFSTPLLYGVFGAIATGDYARDKNRWQHLAVLLHALAILLAAAAFELPLAAALFALGAFGLWFEPFAVDLGNTNVNALLGLSLAGALLAHARGKHLAAGAILGLGIAFKPTLGLAPLPLLLALGFAREWKLTGRLLGGLAAGGLAGIVLGAWLGGGFGAWIHWAGELPKLLREGAAYEDNFALARWLSDHLGLALGPGLVALVLAPCALAAWRARTRAPDARACAAWLATGALFALLTPGLVWIHYYELAIPALLCLVSGANPLALGAAVLGALALSAQLPGQWFGLVGTKEQASLVLAGALLVFVALLARLSAPAARA